MPSFIFKPTPDVDWYVTWSSVVDAPTDWGPRAHVAANLNDAAQAARFDRADATGTSALWPSTTAPYGGWHDPDYEFIVMEGIAELLAVDRRTEGGGYYTVPRTKLREFCELLDANQDPTPVLVFNPPD